MTAFTPDPVLDRLRSQDPTGFRAVLGELLESAPLSLAGYEHLDERQLQALSRHVDEEVRALVAARPDLPDAVLRWLSRDPASGVRSRVAENPQAPIELVRQLAADEDAGVRRGAASQQRLVELPEVLARLARDEAWMVRASLARNPATPVRILLALANDAESHVMEALWQNPNLSEELEATLVLAGCRRPERQRRVLEFRQTGLTTARAAALIADDPELTPAELHSIFMAVQDEYTRSALAENPAADDALLSGLVREARHPRVFLALWRRFFPSQWPSTHAFTQAGTSPQTLALLCAAGHPAGILRCDLPDAEVSVRPAEAFAQLVHSDLLILALWRELALAGTFKLVAWAGYSGDWGAFVLVTQEREADAHTAVNCILGGDSTSREWAEREDYLTEDDAIRCFKEEEPILDEFSEDALDYAMCSAIAWGAWEEADHLTVTEAGEAFILKLGETQGDFDPADMSSRVVLKESSLPMVGFGFLAPEKQMRLVELLRGAREDSLVRDWQLADHFLRCVVNHPETAPDVCTAARECLSGTGND